MNVRHPGLDQQFCRLGPDALERGQPAEFRARYEARKPTIITTNLVYDDWGQYLKNPSLTAALLSRLRHRCITINIKGPDLRDLKEPKE